MNKLHTNPFVGTLAYVSPACLVVEFIPEGLLCQSGVDGDIIHEGIFGDDSELI